MLTNNYRLVLGCFSRTTSNTEDRTTMLSIIVAEAVMSRIVHFWTKAPNLV